MGSHNRPFPESTQHIDDLGIVRELEELPKINLKTVSVTAEAPATIPKKTTKRVGAIPDDGITENILDT